MYSCRHLDLPFAGLAVGGHAVDSGMGNLLEKGIAYLLGIVLILFLESVGSGDAAAYRLQGHEFQSGYHFQQ